MSQITIINTALSKLGANTITSLNDGSIESQQVNLVWDNVRKSLLRLHPWNFAIKTAILPRLSQHDHPLYTYAFLLPADCIRVLRIEGNPIYKLEGRSIYTDVPVITLRYVFDNIDTASWDEAFADVLAERIAYELAYTFTKSNSYREALFATFSQKFQAAKFIDSTEDTADSFGQEPSTFLSARY
ncbi:hypothetical protein Q9Q94_10300 [Uliginosibacterium sp. 31-16]|uniref:hypothetical protein n=1 Tax=Uliginosibacterium sp. 31-16 TaxID=3068315 RepID=UPI00273ED9CE|nr:hypothetical protein [Uliginosibacterium sp. 31-16]MDP5239926.1 hypothetical protein [Uliginosibacterium sp. 31-16]